ncbi:MAG: tetratricopeptide repeat protein, partial [Spirochaetes bacterium]|nr:tetratricopeptide repeat protein [Spirochaetota bacterium]
MKKRLLIFLVIFFCVSQIWAENIKEGIAFYNKKDYKKAKVVFLQVIKDDIHNFTAFYYLGKVSMLLGDNDDAVLAFKRAIELQPNNIN